MKLFAFIAAALLVGGCASTPIIPPELQYTPPTAASGSLATLQGSQEESLLLDDLTVFVIAVDGKRVMIERKGWNNALPILPGSRNITVAFKRGVFNAQADLPLSAVGGHQYEVRFASDVNVNGPNTYCDFWVIDKAMQKPVTEIRRGIIGGGGETMVPIFIPKK